MTGRAKASSQGRRSAARLATVQALYQMDVADAPSEQAMRGFREKRWSGADPAFEPPEPDGRLFDDLVLGVSENCPELDAALNAVLAEGHAVERLEIVLRAILRAGAYELKAVPDVPAKVVINEYVELAHAFFSGKEPALVNAVLDRLAHTLRPNQEAPDRADGQH